MKYSKLQKEILITLFGVGKRDDVIGIYEDAIISKKVDSEFQQEKLQLVKERGWKDRWQKKDDFGEVCTSYRIIQYRLFRAELACRLFDWEKNKHNYDIGYGWGYFDGNNIKNYACKQVILTNSLRSLEAKSCVEFLDCYGFQIKRMGKTRARMVQLTNEGIRKAEALLTIKS